MSEHHEHLPHVCKPHCDYGAYPLSPHDTRLFGDAVQDAYNAMMTARADAIAEYDPANDHQAADAAQYNTDNAEYDSQVTAGTLVDPDKTTVFNALSGAYSSWVSEKAKVDSAWDNFGAGDAKRQEGLNESNPMIKISKFNMAKDYYNTAKSRSLDAGPIHTTCIGYLSTAEAILL